jgi:signal transduction histidine kinase
LSAILASAQLLKRRSEDPHAHEAATRILASGKHMGRLIEDMLDLARARLAGGIVLKREQGDIKALVERVVRECQAASPERIIETVYSGDFGGHWDTERLAQVASNLIGNALKHGDPAGSVEVQLDGTKQDEITFHVSNRGTIPPELVNHLFDPFRGGRRAPGRSEGLGLGLYIVFQVVKAHGGNVEMATAREDRTVFQVSLPRRPASLE